MHVDCMGGAKVYELLMLGFLAQQRWETHDLLEL